MMFDPLSLTLNVDDDGTSVSLSLLEEVLLWMNTLSSNALHIILECVCVSNLPLYSFSSLSLSILSFYPLSFLFIFFLSFNSSFKWINDHLTFKQY